MYATDINPKSLKHAESGIFSRDNWDKYAKNYEQSQPKGRFEDYLRLQVRYGGARPPFAQEHRVRRP